MTAMRVHAVIPAYNEAGSIASVVEGVHRLAAGVTVVDDGSSDGTAALASAAGAHVISLPVNSGKGMAIRVGIEHALTTGCTHVLFLDGDGQHLPEEAGRLIETAVETGADVVVGERQFDRSVMPASRFHANRIGSRALSAFLGVEVLDTQCGFRVFTAHALRGMTLTARGYEIETEMIVKVRRRGGRIARAPVTLVYGAQRSKLKPVRDTTRTCFLAVYYRYIEPV
jgi:glycosyltransferase involved in cell wall biosynthesis